jgi:N4-(beta-N-acetylglucosaminyl)-L-asparaginase
MSKIQRRDFLKYGALSTALPFSGTLAADTLVSQKVKKPILISTWDHGLLANKKAWTMLGEGSKGIDAIQEGVMIVESDPDIRTVGIGGFPDREGKVTLDACIMDENSNCGAVAFLQHIKNPIAVARKVMDDTPHVMLVGNGALQFALESGFKKENLLTDASKNDWENWKKESRYKPVINIENHDTISALALDNEGNLSGVCTTSGAAYKMHGRVGDSPIIGAGLFVDNAVGAAAATGLGEAVVRTSGSAMVVEAMWYGKTPQEACEEIVKRIMTKHEDFQDLQVGFIAIDKYGNYGAYSIKKGFTFALSTSENGHEMFKAKSLYS